MSERSHLSTLYHMVPSEEYQYTGIVKLLQHFHWKWVGIIFQGDEKGDKFGETLEHMFSQSGICAAFTKKLPVQDDISEILNLLEPLLNIRKFLSETNVNVSVVHADTHTMVVFQLLLNMFEMDTVMPIHKVWVMTAPWDFSTAAFQSTLDVQVFHGALSFAIQSSEVQMFSSFLQTLNPHSNTDGFIKTFWEQAFNCFFPGNDVHRDQGQLHWEGEVGKSSWPSFSNEHDWPKLQYLQCSLCCGTWSRRHSVIYNKVQNKDAQRQSGRKCTGKIFYGKESWLRSR